MKKNLHFVLALTLGLATTVSAQDWSVDSRTRVNSIDDVTMGEQSTSTDQRVRTSVSFGGDNVSAFVELNASTTLGYYASLDGKTPFDLQVRQAYASTDLMGFASLTAGRKSLQFGNGRIIGDNDWTNGVGSTFDGLMFAINNDFADIHIGYAATDLTLDDNLLYDGALMYANIGKSMGEMAFNVLYVNATDDAVDMDIAVMALDASYNMSNGLVLGLGYYTRDDGSVENDLTSLSAHYSVNDDITVHAGYDMYGEGGFSPGTWSAFGDFNGSGMEYSTFDYEGTDVSFGGSYSMGDFAVGLTMHNVTDEAETIDYNVTDLSLGYTLTENSSVKLNYATTDRLGNDDSYAWMSLHIGF